MSELSRSSLPKDSGGVESLTPGQALIVLGWMPKSPITPSVRDTVALLRRIAERDSADGVPGSGSCGDRSCVDGMVPVGEGEGLAPCPRCSPSAPVSEPESAAQDSHGAGLADGPRAREGGELPEPEASAALEWIADPENVESWYQSDWAYEAHRLAREALGLQPVPESLGPDAGPQPRSCNPKAPPISSPPVGETVTLVRYPGKKLWFQVAEHEDPEMHRRVGNEVATFVRLLDTSHHDRRLAERMKDPEFREEFVRVPAVRVVREVRDALAEVVRELAIPDLAAEPPFVADRLLQGLAGRGLSIVPAVRDSGVGQPTPCSACGQPGDVGA